VTTLTRDATFGFADFTVGL